MSCDDCSNLDAFLMDDLPADLAARFASHLDGCASCRDAVDQQRWIDGLLTSQHVQELELPSETLVDAFRATIVSRRRSTRLIVGAIATAAALAIGVGWTVLNRQASDVADSGAMAGNSRSNNVTRPTAATRGNPPRATFVSGPDLLVVPVASPHPDVTVVRVYPTYQPRYDAQANIETFNLDYLNGG